MVIVLESPVMVYVLKLPVRITPGFFAAIGLVVSSFPRIP
jgi:hypothetical protein